MFDHNSRYHSLEDATWQAPDRRVIKYKRRRFLPQGEKMPLLVEVMVAPGERLDAITANHLRDPFQFWQVCDANNAMNPFDLVAEAGRRLRVPLPQFQET